MSQLKRFSQYLKESNEEDQEELRSMGIGDKTELDGMDAVVDALNDHFWGDQEVHRLYRELKARLVTLCGEFKDQYEYEDRDMYAAAEQFVEYARDDSDSLSTAIADTLFDELT